MNPDLQQVQRDAGATFTVVADQEVAATYGNDVEALAAAHAGVALCDRSHWGRLSVSGDDRLRFLHNQTTNHFQRLAVGQGCDTVFVTSTARTIDLATAYILADAIWLITHPTCRQFLIQWMDRFIFPFDKVVVSDLTQSTVMFSVMGIESDRLLETLGAGAIVGQPYGTHQAISLNGLDVRVAVGSGLVSPGYTLLAEASQAVELWQRLTQLGAIPLGEQGWERLRVEQGRPVPGHELTEDYNPLEAGLWQTLSFDKGCYIGQETIARLDTYKGVKQQLWGVRLNAIASLGDAVWCDGQKIGKLTSVLPTEQGSMGLAYIRTRAGGEGLSVNVGEAEGQVVEVPFLTRDRQS